MGARIENKVRLDFSSFLCFGVADASVSPGGSHQFRYLIAVAMSLAIYALLFWTSVSQSKKYGLM